MVCALPAPVIAIDGAPPSGAVRFRSPLSAPSPPTAPIESRYVPAGTAIVTVPLPVYWLACMTAARSVQVPSTVWHAPSRTSSSTPSSTLLTANVGAAHVAIGARPSAHASTDLNTRVSRYPVGACPWPGGHWGTPSWGRIPTLLTLPLARFSATNR